MAFGARGSTSKGNGADMYELWPWFVLAGLGAFHGANPAMGWLFAVALGLHEGSLTAVLRALPPIALGHAASIVIVAGLVMLSGVVIRGDWIYEIAGALLIGWAIYLHFFGHHHQIELSPSTSQTGLMIWSFLMATAHGAGLMLLPALLPLCVSGGPAAELLQTGSVTIVLAAVALHTAAMLAVTAVVAIVAYRWVGLTILHTNWLSADFIWKLALAVTGFILVVTG